MGVYTFDNFRDYLKLRFGNADEFESPINYYGIWTNNAYRQLTTKDRLILPDSGGRGNVFKLKLPELETDTTKTTTDGQAYITTPTDALIVRHIFDETNDRKLKWIPWARYVKYTDRADTAAEGDPTEWHHRGANTYLHSTPDDSVTSLRVYYKKRYTALSAGTDVTLLGAEWDDVVLELAFIEGNRWLNRWDLAKAAQASLVEMVSGLITVYDTEEKDRDEFWRPDPAYNQRGSHYGD